MDIEIRLAEKDDVQVIALLARITFTETFGHLFRDPQDLLDYYETTFSVSKLTSSLDKPTNVFWIALADKLPVGYAKLKLDSISPFIDEKSVCQLQKIYVLKDFLSQRIGHRLQDAMIVKAINLGYKKIWLSVLNSNERAIRFYKKNEFSICGDHKFSIGKENFDFHVMVKNLIG